MTKHRVFRSKDDEGISERMERPLPKGSDRVEAESGANTFGDRVVDTAWKGLKDGVVTAATQVVDDWPSNKRMGKEDKSESEE